MQFIWHYFFRFFTAFFFNERRSSGISIIEQGVHIIQRNIDSCAAFSILVCSWLLAIPQKEKYMTPCGREGWLYISGSMSSFSSESTALCPFWQNWLLPLGQTSCALLDKLDFPPFESTSESKSTSSLILKNRRAGIP